MMAGEAIHVFVTLRAGAEITPEAIITHCREKLAKHMVPEVITIIKSLPLNPHGKVIKSELRKIALNGSNKDVLPIGSLERLDRSTINV